MSIAWTRPPKPDDVVELWKSAQALRNALRVAENDAALWRALIVTYIALGEPTYAAVALREADSTCGADWRFSIARAQLHVSRGELPEALDELVHAITFIPYDPLPYLLLGETWHTAKFPEIARSCLAIARELDRGGRVAKRADQVAEMVRKSNSHSNVPLAVSKAAYCGYAAPQKLPSRGGG